MESILKNIPSEFKGEIIDREEACRICGHKSGKKISVIDYWDLRTSNLVKCSNCNLAQLDPMITHDETAIGCLAYYVKATLRNTKEKEAKNLLRNFRRGFLFGRSLEKQGIEPKKVLEMGPGSGYFLEGLKFVFPEIEITVMDVNKEVLQFNSEHHGYKPIENILEKPLEHLENQFDLVVARDVIEHVVDIKKVVENIQLYLSDQGLFHFTTPNGHEDLWKHYLTYNQKNKHSELLLNHVNYFDGKGLLDFLKEQAFEPLKYYTYKLKTTRRGRGWKVSEKLMSPVSQKLSSSLYANEKIKDLENFSFIKSEVLKSWYINKSRKMMTYIISSYLHANPIRVSPELNVGHEIYGLFQVNK